MLLGSLIAQGSSAFNDDNMHFLADIYHESWAVIIGINEYKHMQNLNYAVNDAKSVKEMLMKNYNYKEDHIKMILNENATKNGILEGFNELLQEAKEDDRVIVFYAGHGETYTLPSGGEKGYLVPVDGDPENLFLTSIPMHQLYEIANMSYAKHILYLVDACYGGLALAATRGLKKSVPNYIQKITREKGRQIITAGGKDEQVLERSEWGHSAFTKNLLTGLENKSADMDADGVITANELGSFLAERVYSETEGYHTPQVGRIGTEQGEFIFFNSAELGDNTSFAEYKAKSEARKQQFATAKTLSWIYPGLGHGAIEKPGKGILLLTMETVSLAMTFIAMNNLSIASDDYSASEASYNGWTLGSGIPYSQVEAQYLTDHDALKSAQMQFYGFLTSSVAIWAYNLYDVRKLRYNYADNGKNRFNISFTPDRQVSLQIKF